MLGTERGGVGVTLAALGGARYGEESEGDWPSSPRHPDVPPARGAAPSVADVRPRLSRGAALGGSVCGSYLHGRSRTRGRACGRGSPRRRPSRTLAVDVRGHAAPTPWRDRHARERRPRPGPVNDKGRPSMPQRPAPRHRGDDAGGGDGGVRGPRRGAPVRTPPGVPRRSRLPGRGVGHARPSSASAGGRETPRVARRERAAREPQDPGTGASEGCPTTSSAPAVPPHPDGTRQASRCHPPEPPEVGPSNGSSEARIRARSRTGVGSGQRSGGRVGRAVGSDGVRDASAAAQPTMNDGLTGGGRARVAGRGAGGGPAPGAR